MLPDTRKRLSRNNLSTDIDLHLLLNVIQKKRKLIVVFTLGVTLISALISFYVLSPIYEAKALLMVTVASDKLETETMVTRQVAQSSQGTTVNKSTTMPVLTMNTYLGQMKSEAVMKRILEHTDLPGQTVGSLGQKIEASIVPDSNLIEVSVKDKDPQTAYKIATALAEQYLQLMEEFMFSSVVVVSQANVPEVPIKPNKGLNIAMGFFMGLMLAIILAFVMEFIDNTLKTPDDVNSALNLPVLGLIPIKSGENIH